MKKAYFLTLIAMLFCCLGMNAAAELTFSNVSLAEGSKVESLVQNQQITFNTNMDKEIGYMYADIWDVTDNKVVLSRVTVYDPNYSNGGDFAGGVDAPQNYKDPHFTFVCPSTTTMTEEHKYEIRFYAFASKDDSHGGESALAKGILNYEGATPGYIGSRFKLLSITPDPETHVITSADNRSATLHFNGKVRMEKKGTFINTGFGSSAELESIVPAEAADTVITIAHYLDKDGKDSVARDTAVYCNAWTLTPKVGTISDGADVIFAANAFDKAGLHVCEGTKYSTGDDVASYYTFTMSNDLGRETVAVSPATSSTVKNLSSFIVSEGEGVAVAGAKEPAVVYQVAEDGSKTEVAQVKWNADLVVRHSEDDNYATKIQLFLDKAVTKAGKYILHFPRGYFLIGSGMTAGATASQDFEYTIASDATPYTVAFTPSDDQKISKLANVQVAFTDENEDGEPKYTLGFEDMEVAKAYFFNESKELVTTASFDFADNMDDYNAVKVILKDAIVAPGKYTMVIPDGQFTYGVDEGGMWAKKYRTARGGASLGGDDEDLDDEDIDYNALIVKEFTVEAGSTDEVKLSIDIKNGATVAKMDGIKLTFDGAESVATTSGMVWWRGQDVAGNYVSVTSVLGNVVTLQPSSDMSSATSIETAGTYVLTIPAGYIQVNGADWPQIEFTFTVDPTVDGINGVNADANSAKSVYTLNGIKVDGKAKNGTFIVNGKKVVLK